MVKMILGSEEYFRKYIFWLVTFSTMVIVGGVSIAVGDHYSYKNHKENSVLVNNQQTNDIKATQAQLNELIRTLNQYSQERIKAEEEIKGVVNTNKLMVENNKYEINKLRDKVRGGTSGIKIRNDKFEPMGM